jgi:PIN domain nuclease of toxin-antitoxin system
MLLDSNILISLTRRELERLGERMRTAILSPGAAVSVSAVCLWEIAIKTRLGKLDPGMRLGDLPGYVRSMGMLLLPIDERHAVTEVAPEPETSDPFDRMLLAQCQVEGLRLVTLDRKLASHPLVWRPD